MNFVINKKMEDTKPLKNKKLMTKTAVKFLLEGKLKTNVCRYCLNVDTCLWELDRVLNIAIKGTSYTVSIRTMVASFHHVKVDDDPNFPNKICETCLEQSLSSYIFSQQCEKAERALRNCFEDVYEKLSKLDPIEQNTKKRGRQKLIPNYNTLYVAHENVIDYAEPIINIINTTSSLTDETKTEISPNQCPKCWLEFPNLTQLRNHEKIHPKSMWYHCRLCGKSFPKANHLKKHIFSSHKYSATQMNQRDFKCKECGYISETYSQHLQHVEKHKFKTFMKHIVENQMDKLCTVCLDKGMGLTDINKMICFHGGTPGLSGDVKLKNIIGSTITNKNMNKYRELYVPRYANIMKISRRKLEVTSLPTRYHFIFANPLLIDTENHQELDTSLNLHLCSEPKTSGIENQIVSLIKPRIDDEQNEFHLTDKIKCFDESTDLDDECEIPVSDPQINNSKTVVDTNKCKKCWIFGKCVCHKSDCIKKNNANPQKCNYCWIFKNTEKCYYCHKFNLFGSKIYESDVREKIVENKQTNAIEQIHVIKTNESDNNINNNEDQEYVALKKSKLDKGTTSWLCQICLTQNTNNIRICLCCDSDKLLHNDIKFNFLNDAQFYEKTETCINNNHKASEEDLKQQTVSTTDLNPNIMVTNIFENETKMEIEQPILNVADKETQQIDMEICNEENQGLNTSDTPISDLNQDETITMSCDEPLKNINVPSNVIFTIGPGNEKVKKRLKRRIRTSRN